MTQNPDREHCGTDNLDESGNKPEGTTVRYGSPEDPRRAFWTLLVEQFEDSAEGVDWNDVLEAAEANGIERKWAHEEIKRRLHWDDVHLYQGDLYPHHEGRR